MEFAQRMNTMFVGESWFFCSILAPGPSCGNIWSSKPVLAKPNANLRMLRQDQSRRH